eukprot:PITA_26058
MEPPPSAPSEAEAFISLLSSLPKKKSTEAAKFFKRLEDIPEISLPPEKSIQGFFLFEFTKKEDKELIFRNGPYFMGPQGLYLNKWTSDFDPIVDVPSAVPMWVHLPNLLMHCWNWESLMHIGNTLGKFIDRANNKDQFDCTRICVEVDLEIVLPEAIKIKVGSWSHIQKLDYEQLPFKCRKCHVYGHFARDCPKNSDVEKGKEEGWTQVKRAKNKPPRTGNNNTKVPQADSGLQTPHMEDQRNKFNQLSSATKNSQGIETPNEGPSHNEPQPESKQADKNTVITEEIPSEETEDGQSSEDSEEEGEIESTRASPRWSIRDRNTARENREQETYKDKVQGSQPTLEKILSKTPKMTRNQIQSSKGASHSKSK